MNIDWSKIKNSKTLKWTLIIALPTIVVGAYYGGKYIKKKYDESKLSTERKQQLEEASKMREKYKDINTPDDFIEGMKWMEQPVQWGYDFSQLDKKKDVIDKIPMDKLKRMYELSKKPLYESPEFTTPKKTADESAELLYLLKLIYG